MAWALVDDYDIVVNRIEYDGVAEYTPPQGLRLVGLTTEKEHLQIGESINTPPPAAPE